MKILQLGKFYPIRGGVEKVMWDITRGLDEAGVSCDMLCACLHPEEAGELKFPGGNRVICIKSYKKVAATMLAPAMVRWMRRHASEYDIVHIHHPDPMAALALRLSGFKGPVVLHWHSDILSQKALLALYRPLQSWLIRRATRIVCTTPVYLRESPWLQAVQDKGVAIPIGIDPIQPDSEKADALRSRFPGKNILLSIGRLVPYKGYGYLVDAMRELPENYQLILGGAGPLERELRQQVHDAGLDGRVTFLGYVPDEDMAGWYAAAHLFVLPSVFRTEAFGIVQIEAMSCGCPVVATIIPGSGVSWVNKDGVSGVNVPPGDSHALAQGIIRAMQNRKSLSDGARSLFQERYTFHRMINQIINLYENLL